ncbi:MAG: type II toxin-antitoxin system VapC family toxin [Marmoricola sp.]
MSTLLVIDASVVMKCVVIEAGSDAAVALLTAVGPGVSLVAPEHLLGEVGNGLRKRVAQGVLTANDAGAALDTVAELDLELIGGPERWLRSLRDALDWGVTTYDALYVLWHVTWRRSWSPPTCVWLTPRAGSHCRCVRSSVRTWPATDPDLGQRAVRGAREARLRWTTGDAVRLRTQ